MTLLQVADIVEDSIVDGPGLRLTVFVQGCVHNCPSCHNQQTHDPKGGKAIKISAIQDMLMDNPMQSGLTISGGEPLLQANQLIELCHFAKENKKNVWLYTGYTWEEIQTMNDPSINMLLNHVDVLVDGRFILSQRDLNLLFRGSKNQRLIDVNKSLSTKEIVLI